MKLMDLKTGIVKQINASISQLWLWKSSSNEHRISVIYILMFLLKFPMNTDTFMDIFINMGMIPNSLTKFQVLIHSVFSYT